MKNVFYSQSTSNYRAVAVNAAGQRWNGSAWETHNDSNWATYLISPTQLGTSTTYVYSVPDDALVVFIYSGASPVVTDLPVATAPDALARVSIR